MGIAAREVGARRAKIWLEQRVVDEDSISDAISDRCQRVWPGVNITSTSRLPILNCFAVRKELVPLRTVGEESFRAIVHFFQSFCGPQPPFPPIAVGTPVCLLRYPAAEK